MMEEKPKKLHNVIAGTVVDLFKVFSMLFIFLLIILFIFLIYLCMLYKIETSPNTEHTIRLWKDIDQKEFEGIENLSPNAQICNGYCYDYPVSIENEKGRPIYWGPFILSDSLYFYHGRISIYRFEKIRDEDQIEEIKNKGCNLSDKMEFSRKDSVRFGYNYSDFELDECTLSKLDIKFNKLSEYQRKNIDVSFITIDNYMESGKIPKTLKNNFSVNRAIKIPNERIFYFLTGDKKHKLASNYSRLTLVDEWGNIQLVRDLLNDCDGDCFKPYPENKEQNTATSVTLGKCDYPQKTEVYVTNFKDNEADWYFNSENGKPFSSECQMQRLPYYVEEIKKEDSFN